MNQKQRAHAGGAIDFDRYSRNYRNLLDSSLTLSGETNEYFDQYKLACLKKWVSNDAPAATMLDFGCGIGKLAYFMAKAFPRSRITGYDVSKKSLETAKTQGKHLCNLTFSGALSRDAVFDVITISNVFHHIEPNHRQSILRSLKERLTPGGRIVVFEQNPLNMLTRYVVSTCPFDADAKLIRLCHFVGLARRCGLYVVDKRYIVFFPKFLSKLRNLENHMGFLPLGAQYMIVLCNHNRNTRN